MNVHNYTVSFSSTYNDVCIIFLSDDSNISFLSIFTTCDSWYTSHYIFRYLHEIGYTDTIIDVRSNRVRSLLGLHDVPGIEDRGKEDSNIRTNINGGDVNTSRRNIPDNNAGSGGGSGANRRVAATTLAEEMMMDTEAAVMANFDFLSSEGEVDDDDEVMGEDGDDGYSPEIKLKGSDALDQVDKETEEVVDFNYVSGSKQDSNDAVDGLKGDDHESDVDGNDSQTTDGDWGNND